MENRGRKDYLATRARRADEMAAFDFEALRVFTTGLLLFETITGTGDGGVTARFD
jgi:hypothetical protein